MNEPIARPDEQQTRLRAAMSATGRLGMAAILAYLFVVVLMTASAQSEVAANLAQIERPAADKATGVDRTPEYTSSYARLRKADRELEKFTAKYPDDGLPLRAAATSAKARFEQARSEFEEASRPVWQLADAMTARGVCELTKPVTRSPAEASAIFASVEQCDYALSAPDLKGRVLAVAQTKKALTEVSGRLKDAYQQAMSLDRELETFNAKSIFNDKEQTDLADIRQAFAPVFVLQDRWMLGGGILVPFPPSMMQIIMAFFSGLFGALLVTLVLVVYPNSDLNITTPGGNYGERVLLGGLIAVCVFIVLGGGTAVLGTSNAFADGTANFQAFSAIGVLAGMFSDRVAGWLSDKAVNFYGRNPPVPDRPEPAPPVPAPPPAPIPAAG